MINSLEEARKEINRIDEEMAKLFEGRMECAEVIAEYKKENNLPIFDKKREEELVERNSGYIENQGLREYYKDFLLDVMSISKKYQKEIIHHCDSLKVADGATVLPISLGERSYDIHIEKGSISKMAEIFGIKEKRAFIITDNGVPKEYAMSVADGFASSYIYTVNQGEGSKSLETYGEIMARMIEIGMTRSDVCIAVGGGVVGDLTGFVAATYMRGVDFYNVPTTLLSMVDSSIGGKTAINHGGVKNIVGAFHQPKGVLIDTDALSTLPQRQMVNGIAESIKMAATSNANFFSMLEGEDCYENIEAIIVESLKIKKAVVEQDEREGGLRKILNFGHTFGHAVEAATNMDELYHGECVAIGMMAITYGDVNKRLGRVLKKYNLPTEYMGDISSTIKLMTSDKKRSGDTVDAVFVEEIGRGEIKRIKVSDLEEIIKKNLGGQE
jgi:3-dehydroquinate synthase